MSLLRKLAGFFLEFLETVVLALLVFAVLYIFVFQPHQVKGNSMLPNFINGEYLLTNKIVYRIGKPERGNIIIFKAPDHAEYDYIKRIIGMPGDTIKVLGGSVYVNGQRIDESAYLSPTVKTNPGRFLREGREITVPQGEYFAVGDNRNNSSDSRDFGPVPFENIVGKAWLMYWPINKIGLIEDTTYTF